MYAEDSPQSERALGNGGMRRSEGTGFFPKRTRVVRRSVGIANSIFSCPSLMQV